MTDSTNDTTETPAIAVIHSLSDRKEQELAKQEEAIAQLEDEIAKAYMELTEIALEAMLLGKRTVMAVELSPGQITTMGNCGLADQVLAFQLATQVALDNYVAAQGDHEEE